MNFGASLLEGVIRGGRGDLTIGLPHRTAIARVAREFVASPNNDRKPPRDRDFTTPRFRAMRSESRGLVRNCKRGAASDRAQATRWEILDAQRVELIPQRFGLNRKDRADRVEREHIVVAPRIHPTLNFLELAPMKAGGRVLGDGVASNRIFQNCKEQPGFAILRAAARDHS